MNSDKIKKSKILQKKYGITFEEYSYMLGHDQGGVCAICKSRRDNVPIKQKLLPVDHDHKTGKVRGILCGKCNRAMGLLDENIRILERMIAYLIKHNAEPTNPLHRKTHQNTKPRPPESYLRKNSANYCLLTMNREIDI